MSKIFNINILKGLDANESDLLAKALEYVCKQVNINANVKIISSLDINLKENDFVLLHLDELTLNKLVEQANNKDFFTSKTNLSRQILLMLDDVKMDSLPEYLHYLPTFEIVFSELNLFGNEGKSVKQTTIIQVIHDIVLFINEVNDQDSDKITIFIGPSDDNTTIEYQKIVRELLHRNHHLLPKILNPTAKEIIHNPEILNAMLDKAELCIHFLGHSSIEEYPETVSPAMKVNELVAQYCEGNPKIKRIIYVPAEDGNTAELTRLKTVQFKSNIKALQSAELVQTPIEKFKDIVLTKINQIIAPDSKASENAKEESLLYFIYAPGEDGRVGGIMDWFNKNNIKFNESQVDLDQLALLAYHQKKLQSCSGVVIYAHGNKSWLTRKMSDLLKAPGWGRDKKFEFKTIIGDTANLPSKEDIIGNGVGVFDVSDESSFDKLKTTITK